MTGVISLGALLYSWLVVPGPRDLNITSDPPVAIVKAGQASSLDILYHGEKIRTDVFARQVYLWNAGSDSIRRENVLEQIGIVIPHATILEARVKKVSRPLTNIAAKIDRSDRVTLSWNILEYHDGAAIDVIYAAPDASKMSAVGTVEHQPEVRVREYQAAREVTLQGWQRTVILSFMGGLGLFLCILALMLVKAVVAPKEKLRALQIIVVCIFITLAMLGGGAVLWRVLSFARTEVMPPVF